MARVLIISGSPRKSGNVEQLLDRVAIGATGEGATVETIRLADSAITPCAECLACHAKGVCAVIDDMPALQAKVLDADAIVFGAPIFFLGLPAHAKAFVDRCQPLWVMKNVLKMSLMPGQDKRPGAFVSAAATSQRDVFDGAVRTARAMFASMDVHCLDTLLVNGVDEATDILDRSAELAQAEQLGGLVASAISP